jgi:hypothetical protein
MQLRTHKDRQKRPSFSQPVKFDVILIRCSVNDVCKLHVARLTLINPLMTVDTDTLSHRPSAFPTSFFGVLCWAVKTFQILKEKKLDVSVSMSNQLLHYNDCMRESGVDLWIPSIYVQVNMIYNLLSYWVMVEYCLGGVDFCICLQIYTSYEHSLVRIIFLSTTLIRNQRRRFLITESSSSDTFQNLEERSCKVSSWWINLSLKVTDQSIIHSAPLSLFAKSRA